MNHKQVKDYFLSKPEAIEDYPFGPEVAVYKVRKKMFSTLATEKGIFRINLKCEPHEALALRDVFESVIPGYHMNKKHWNTVILDGTVPDFEIKRMIDNSFALVISGLKKPERQSLEIKFSKQALYGKS